MMTARQIEGALRAGGASRSLAKLLVCDLKALAVDIGPASAPPFDLRGLEAHLRCAGASRSQARRLAGQLKGLAITVAAATTIEGNER